MKEPNTVVHSPTSQNRVAAGIAPESTVAELSKQALTAYQAMKNVVAPISRDWPKVERGHRETRYNDYDWFVDYFGNSMQMMHYAELPDIEKTQRGIYLMTGLHGLEQRRHEFTRLEARIVESQRTGSINDAQATQAVSAVHALWKHTEPLMHKLTHEVQAGMAR